MSRLLFAAARGAQIQRAHFITPDEWEPARLIWASTPVESNYDYRIHPEDEHLQYGPVSTALRNSVLGLPVNHAYNSENMMQHFLRWGHTMGCPSIGDWKEQNDTYKLFMAEALADEGL